MLGAPAKITWCPAPKGRCVLSGETGEELPGETGEEGPASRSGAQVSLSGAPNLTDLTDA